MIIYTPADDATRQAMESLLSGAGSDAQFPCYETHRRRERELVTA
jgi:hypothetical protein